jgi:hypothetical protein
VKGKLGQQMGCAQEKIGEREEDRVGRAGARPLGYVEEK